jgi:hypothetical protein
MMSSIVLAINIHHRYWIKSLALVFTCLMHHVVILWKKLPLHLILSLLLENLLIRVDLVSLSSILRVNLSRAHVIVIHGNLLLAILIPMHLPNLQRWVGLECHVRGGRCFARAMMNR